MKNLCATKKQAGSKSYRTKLASMFNTNLFNFFRSNPNEYVLVYSSVFYLDLQILKIKKNIKLNILCTVKCTQYTRYHIQTAQYTRNKPRERTYLKKSIVDLEAGLI